MKIERKVLIVLIILWVAVFSLTCYLYSHRIPEKSIEKIESLDSQIDSIQSVKDSIQERIDTVYIELQENNKQYEENINRIVNNTPTKDYLFFRNYIESNRERLDSICDKFRD